jgi:hypothetical protein
MRITTDLFRAVSLMGARAGVKTWKRVDWDTNLLTPFYLVDRMRRDLKET